jgi:zinc transporter, ZIP family
MTHHMSDHNQMHEIKHQQNIQKRNRLLLISLALHHIPENLALGITFAAVYVTFGLVTLTSAFSLAIGLAIHNFPEGMAAALPLRSEGMSRSKSFYYGQSIGIVAPIAGITGAILITTIEPIIPYSLGFAAGAMLFVTIRHIIPHILKSQNTKIGLIFAISGFTLMMLLELLLG